MAGQEILLALSGFKLRDKFSDEAWLERGLNPSAAPVSEKLASIFNHVSDELIKEAEDSAASKSFKKILKKNLSQISIDDFDTEERNLFAIFLWNCPRSLE